MTADWKEKVMSFENGKVWQGNVPPMNGCTILNTIPVLFIMRIKLES